MSLAVIDYGSGNINSVTQSLSFFTKRFSIVSKPSELYKFSKFILPGVGSCYSAIEKIKKLGFKETLDEEVLVNKKPFLGICVGMQILFDNLHEKKTCSGLGWLKGDIVNLDSFAIDEIPHMGWSPVFSNSESEYSSKFNKKDFYFCHSFTPFKYDEKDVTLFSNINETTKIVSMVKKNNIHGVQFHPEISHNNGTKFLQFFIDQ